jgi:aminomethyltransferase
MLKKTPLYEEHVKLKARMVNFAGFEMPIQYSSIIHEHMAVREKAGIFDVSHMGEILVKGQKAGDFLNGILTNNIHKIKEGRVQYTIMTYEDGGTVDDLMVYKLSQAKYLLVVNAANKDKDFEHMKSFVPKDVTVEDVSDEYGLIAIQGPESSKFVDELLGGVGLKPFNFKTMEYDNDTLIISRTGYTGSDGFEVYGQPEAVKKLFCKFIHMGVTPCGLGARDTLRFEAGLPLYGNELGPDITPVEAGLHRFIDLNKPFNGRDVLQVQKEQSDRRQLIGLKLLDRGVPRQGYPVYYEGNQIGKVTSGGFAPYLKKYLAMALVKIPSNGLDNKPFDIEIRGKKRRAEKVSTNFLKATEVR